MWWHVFYQCFRMTPGTETVSYTHLSTEPHPYKREFVKAYMQIIAQLREHYGNIPILLSLIHICKVWDAIWDSLQKDYFNRKKK